MWEIVKRKRPCPVRVDGVRRIGGVRKPPHKKPATAEVVANALNKGFEMQRKGKEKKMTP